MRDLDSYVDDVFTKDELFAGPGMDNYVSGFVNKVVAAYQVMYGDVGPYVGYNKSIDSVIDCPVVFLSSADRITAQDPLILGMLYDIMFQPLGLRLDRYIEMWRAILPQSVFIHSEAFAQALTCAAVTPYMITSSVAWPEYVTAMIAMLLNPSGAWEKLCDIVEMVSVMSESVETLDVFEMVNQEADIDVIPDMLVPIFQVIKDSGIDPGYHVDVEVHPDLMSQLPCNTYVRRKDGLRVFFS